MMLLGVRTANSAGKSHLPVACRDRFRSAGELAIRKETFADARDLERGWAFQRNPRAAAVERERKPAGSQLECLA